MGRIKALKRIAAAVSVFALSACILEGGSGRPLKASAGEAETGSGEENSADAYGFDTSGYLSKLDQITVRQQELKKQLESADKDIMSETEQQTLILEQINAINEKAEVLNAYMTELEMNISAEQREVLDLKDKVDEGIEDYKKHLRALYIAGEVGYSDVLVNSGSFFDVLMRTEFVKRIAAKDAERLDELVELKSRYDSRSKRLLLNESTYDEQMHTLERERAELASLYNTSGETKKLLREKMVKLSADEKVFENEIYSYEGILNDLLLGSYSSDADEALRLQTEMKAAEKLTELHTQIAEREKSGEKLDEYESRYMFAWPVKDHHYVSSGVGARWGSYHTGLDIPGEGGFPISASEAGEVVRTNNTCTHNYGKDGSCGCGGGYGNFVIIDHGNGFLTLYGHLTTTQVEVGDKVKQGDTIGLMGSTGFSTGDHLHFELRYEGYITNPANFVSY